MARDRHYLRDRYVRGDRAPEHRIRRAATATIGGTLLVAAIRNPEVVFTVAAVFLLLYVGVILPAVWSAQPARRRAAREVLQRLLDTLRRPRLP
jgi:hypothetical protein